MPLSFYSCIQVQPNRIEQSSSWDLYPYLGSDEPITQTRKQIEQLGILHPPLALETEGNTYELVSGFRTYNVWSKTNSDQPLFCRILTPSTSIPKILEALYYEYGSHKPLGVIETAHFIRLAREKLQGDEGVARLLESLGIQSNHSYLKRTLQLLELEEHIQREIWTERINESAARELLQLRPADRLTLFTLAQELELGSSKLRRLLFLMRDLAGREGISFNSLVLDPELEQIINHPEMNVPQKGQAILKVLQYRQNSTLYSAEKSFEQWRNGLNLPDSCTVGHSKSFESDETTLTMSFSSRDKLELALPGIRTVIEES